MTATVGDCMTAGDSGAAVSGSHHWLMNTELPQDPQSASSGRPSRPSLLQSSREHWLTGSTWQGSGWLGERVWCMTALLDRHTRDHHSVKLVRQKSLAFIGILKNIILGQ